MKKFLTILTVASGSLLLAACSTNGPSYDELAGHRFVLLSANEHISGNEHVFKNEKQPVIEFRSELQSDKIKVSGKMCNNFMGTAIYNNGVLQADNLAMTRAICSETALNLLDIKIGEMFKQGVKVSKSGDKLVLKSADTTLTYQAQNIKP